MFDEKRQSLRRHLNGHAFIVLDGGRRLCVLNDVSDGGAFLKVKRPAEIPANFILNLTDAGPPCRACRVIWRTDDGVGVEWTGRFSKAACAEGTCTFDCSGAPDGDGSSGGHAGDDPAWP